MRVIKETMGNREEVERFKNACLRMEASGNHGSYGGGPGGTVDMRRGIWFWGTGRGWQLYKSWRDAFSARWPDVELPPKPKPAQRPKRVSRKALERLVTIYRSYRSEIGGLEYWDRGMVRQGLPTGWRVSFWEKEDDRWERWIYLGQDSESAFDTLQRLIAQWKEEKQVTGQEPQLGGQAARSGNEPMISQQSPSGDTPEMAMRSKEES